MTAIPITTAVENSPLRKVSMLLFERNALVYSPPTSSIRRCSTDARSSASPRVKSECGRHPIILVSRSTFARRHGLSTLRTLAGSVSMENSAPVSCRKILSTSSTERACPVPTFAIVTPGVEHETISTIARAASRTGVRSRRGHRFPSLSDRFARPEIWRMISGIK